MLKLLADRGVGLVAGVLLVALIVIVFGQILLRLIGYPLIWAEEVSPALFIWLVFAGVATAYQRRDHLEVDLVQTALAPRLGPRRIASWNILTGALQFLFLIVLAVGLVIMAGQTWLSAFGSLPGFRYSWLYLGVLAAVLASALIVFIHLWKEIRALRTGVESDKL